MPLNREELKKTRDNSLNSSAVLYSRPREVRIDYAPVKKGRDGRRDSRTSHVSHASSMLQGYGCQCPPALKHFAKYIWILILLVYIFVMPYLISKLYMKVTSSNQKLATLEGLLQNHLRAKTITPREVKQLKKPEGVPAHMNDKVHEYKETTKARQDIQRRISQLEKR